MQRAVTLIYRVPAEGNVYSNGNVVVHGCATYPTSGCCSETESSYSIACPAVLNASTSNVAGTPTVAVALPVTMGRETASDTVTVVATLHSEITEGWSMQRACPTIWNDPEVVYVYLK